MPSNHICFSCGTAWGYDLKSFTPTVQITSGVASFDVDQTGNIGRGDKLTYDTDKVVYLYAKTDAKTWQVVTGIGTDPDDTDGTETVVSIGRTFALLDDAIGCTDNSDVDSTGIYQRMDDDIGTVPITSVDSESVDLSPDVGGLDAYLWIACYDDGGYDEIEGGFQGTGLGCWGWHTGTMAQDSKVYVYAPTGVDPTDDSIVDANQNQSHEGVVDGGYRIRNPSGYSSTALLKGSTGTNAYVADITWDGIQVSYKVGNWNYLTLVKTDGPYRGSRGDSIDDPRETWNRMLFYLPADCTSKRGKMFETSGGSFRGGATVQNSLFISDVGDSKSDANAAEYAIYARRSYTDEEDGRDKYYNNTIWGQFNGRQSAVFLQCSDGGSDGPHATFFTHMVGNVVICTDQDGDDASFAGTCFDFLSPSHTNDMPGFENNASNDVTAGTERGNLNYSSGVSQDACNFVAGGQAEPNLHIAAGSVLIGGSLGTSDTLDSGGTTGLAVPALDFDRQTRPAAASCIGADELPTAAAAITPHAMHYRGLLST